MPSNLWTPQITCNIRISVHAANKCHLFQFCLISMTIRFRLNSVFWHFSIKHSFTDRNTPHDYCFSSLWHFLSPAPKYPATFLITFSLFEFLWYFWGPRKFEKENWSSGVNFLCLLHISDWDGVGIDAFLETEFQDFSRAFPGTRTFLFRAHNALISIVLVFGSFRLSFKKTYLLLLSLQIPRIFQDLMPSSRPFQSWKLLD